MLPWNFRLPGAFVALSLPLAPLAAQNSTWLGGPANTPSNWSEPLNWQGGVAPASGASTTLTFSLVSGLGTPANNNLGALTLNRLRFNNLIGTFETSGAPLVFVANGGTDPTFANDTDYPAVVAQNVSFSSPLSFADNGYGSLTIDGTLTAQNGSALTIARTFPTLPSVTVTGPVALADLNVSRGFVTLSGGGSIGGALSANGGEGILVLGDPGNPTGVFNLGAGGSVAVTTGGQLRFVGGTVNLDSPDPIPVEGSLTLSAGVLQSTQTDLTIDFETETGDSAFSWEGGTINGSAGQTLTLNGSVTISSAETKSVRRALITTGTVQAGNGVLAFGGSGSWFVNGSNARFYLNDGISAITAESSGNTFALANEAFLQREGSSVLDFPLPMTQGVGTSVRMASGGMRFTSGGSWNGDFDLASGTTLEFGGGTQVFAGGNQWTGALGTIAFSAGTFRSGGLWEVGNANTVVLLTGGAFTTPASFTASSFLWSGGSFDNENASGVIDSSVNAEFYLQAPSALSLTRHRLTVTGNGYWTGAGDVQLTGSSLIFAGMSTTQWVLNNTAILSSDASSAVRVGAGSRLRKAFSYGITTIGTAFSSLGRIEVATGRLLLSAGSGGGASAGDFDVSVGGVLEFGGGAHLLNGAIWSGTGEVVLSSGILQNDSTAPLGSTDGYLELTGGTLTGGDFNLAGVGVIWTGGTLTTSIPAPFVAASTVLAPFYATGGGTKSLDRRSVNFPSGSWTGGDLQLSGTATTPTTLNMVGPNGAIFSIQSDQSILPGANANVGFTVFTPGNRLIKDTTSGITTIAVPFVSVGSVEVNSGRLLLSAGSGSNANGGFFQAGTNGTIEFGGGTHLLAGPGWGGTGRFVLSAGVLSNPSTASVGSSGAVLELSGGTLTGGNFSVAGTNVNWSGSTLATTLADPFVAASTIFGAFNISGATTKRMNRRSVNFPAGTWTGGDIELTGSATTIASLNLTGASGSIFRIQSDQSVLPGANANVQFTVFSAGNRLIKDTTAGTTNIAVPFSSFGSVEINSGRLLLSAGSGTFANGGAFSTGAAGIFEFGGGTHQLNGVSWQGAGRFVLSSGILQNNASAAVGNTGLTLDLTGGTLTGANFALAGTPINWGGARLTTTIAPGFVASSSTFGPLNLVGAAAHVLDRRSLLVSGGGTWTGGNLEIGGDAATPTLFNLVGGSGTIFRIQSDQSVLPGVGLASFGVLSGNRLIKDTTSGTTTIAVQFGNFGSVETNTGRLLLTAGSGTSAHNGAFNLVGASSVIEFDGGTQVCNGAGWFGLGRVALSSGTLQNNASAAIGNTSLTLDLTGGTLTGVNFALVGAPINWAGTRLTTTIAPGLVASSNTFGALNLVGTATHVLDRRSLLVSGGGTWTGGNLEIGGDASTPTLFNLVGGSGTIFRIQSDQSVLSGVGLASFSVLSGNRLIKDTTSGTTTIAVPFGNSGSVETNTGRLLFTGGSGASAHNGAFNLVGASSVIEFDGGTQVFNGSGWFGLGRVVLTSGTLQNNASAALGNGGLTLDLTGGTLTGVNFALAGAPINWAGTRLATTIAPGFVASSNTFGALNLVGAATHVLDRRSLLVSGGGTWTGGNLEIGGDAAATTAFNLVGGSGTIFRIQCDQAIVPGAGLASVGVNSGNRLLKDTTSGTTTVQVCLANFGTTEVSSGTLLFTASCNSNGGLLTAHAGGTLRVNGAFTGDGNVTIDPSGTLILPGTIIGGGQYQIAGLLDFRGGTLGNGNNTTVIQGGGRVTGSGTFYGAFTNNGVVSTTGTIGFTGPVTNNGVLRFRGGGSLNFFGPLFINNGVLDVITGYFNNYGGGVFVNNGIVLDSSVVKVKRTLKTGDTVSIVVDGYDEHVFQLQYSPDLSTPFTDLGAPQNGTGAELTFSDSNHGAKGFYRVVVNP